ncbi:hypothetical protein BJ322DRAFT_1025842, partial [Thelephora terrestris]
MFVAIAKIALAISVKNRLAVIPEVSPLSLWWVGALCGAALEIGSPANVTWRRPKQEDASRAPAPNDEEIESESEEPHPEEPAAKSRARKVTPNTITDPPELLAGADDEDGPPPGTRERVPRKAKADALNSRKPTDTAMAPEKPVPKVGPPKGGHAKGKGIRERKSNEIEEESDARGVSKAKKFMGQPVDLTHRIWASGVGPKTVPPLALAFGLSKIHKRKRDALNIPLKSTKASNRPPAQAFTPPRNDSGNRTGSRRNVCLPWALVSSTGRQANRLEVLQRRSNSTGFLPVGSHREPFSMTPLT